MRSNNISLKYQNFAPSGFKRLEILKFSSFFIWFLVLWVFVYNALNRRGKIKIWANSDFHCHVLWLLCLYHHLFWCQTNHLFWNLWEHFNIWHCKLDRTFMQHNCENCDLAALCLDFHHIMRKRIFFRLHFRNSKQFCSSE